jgi:hypothetical protein
VHGVAWLSMEQEYGSRFTREDAAALARASTDRLLAGFAAA